MNNYYELLTGYELARCDATDCNQTFNPEDGLQGFDGEMYCSERCGSGVCQSYAVSLEHEDWGDDDL